MKKFPLNRAGGRSWTSGMTSSCRMSHFRSPRKRRKITGGDGEKPWEDGDDHMDRTGVGKCPNWTSPNYWGYNHPQIHEGHVQNHQKGTFTEPGLEKEFTPSPIGSMVLVYMLTYRGYIDGIHVAKYSIHGYYGIYKWWTLNCQAWLPDYRSTGKWVPIWKCANYSTTASVLINRKPHSSWPLDCCLGKAHSETKPGGVHDRNKPGNMSPL